MWELILALLIRIGRFITAGCASCFGRNRDNEHDRDDPPAAHGVVLHGEPHAEAPPINIVIVNHQESPRGHRRHHSHGNHDTHPLNLVNGPTDPFYDVPLHAGDKYMHSTLRRHYVLPEDRVQEGQDALDLMGAEAEFERLSHGDQPRIQRIRRFGVSE
jgi:hypothetical protein